MRSITINAGPDVAIRKAFVLALWLLVPLSGGCDKPSVASQDDHSRISSQTNDSLTVSLTKWYGGHSAAISLTYDHGVRWLSPEEALIQNIVLEENLPMDFDFTNSDLDEWPARRLYYSQTLQQHGIGFFGHGYDHINSDAVAEEVALENFRRCYEDMVAFGTKPVAYAYPGGYCYAASTRRALAASGFLAGRRFSSLDHTHPYICSGDTLVPSDWYDLPSLVMFTHEFSGDPKTIQATSALIPFLDEAVRQRAWLITTYHEIKDGPGGTYAVQDFRDDIQAIKGRDFWIASFNDATLYLRERAKATVDITQQFSPDGMLVWAELLLSDDLSNDLYDHPLTVRISVPDALVGRRFKVSQDHHEIASQVFEPDSLMLSLRPNERPYILEVL